MNEKILEMMEQFKNLTSEDQRCLISALQQINSSCRYERSKENDRQANNLLNQKKVCT